MGVKAFIISLLLIALSGCAVYQTEEVTKIALLAPFEGQYREVGYNALYAAHLAISDANSSTIDLLAIDDGGSIETARLRVSAISKDPSIAAVMVLGNAAASHEAQAALNTIPMLIVGHWNSSPSNDSIFMLTNPQMDSLINFNAEITEIVNASVPINGTEILALQQVSLLWDNLSQIQIYSSSSQANQDFREHYLASAEFAPQPNLLAPLVYDATGLILQSIQTNTPITDIQYEGINGEISFVNSYWLNAPIHSYRYENGILVAEN